MGGKWLNRKPEPSHIQGTCVKCLERPQMSSGGGKFKAICRDCSRAKYYPELEYKLSKGSICVLCGFVPEHRCQLDVDHIDGNKANTDPSNLQTLCANCHRLKTWQNLDWKKMEPS